MVDKKSMYHVPHADKKVSGWDKLSGLHLKLFPNEWGSLILAKAYINNKDWYSYQFLSFKTLDCLNSASVWLLYVALFIIRIARFWSTSALCMTDWLAFPVAKIPYVTCCWMSAKYNVLSTGKICFIFLIENKARYILLLMCLKWYFHVWCSSSKMPQNLVDCSCNWEPIRCNLVLFIPIFNKFR